MNPALLIVLSLACVFPAAGSEDPWNTRAGLRQLGSHARSTMLDYASWSEEYVVSRRKPGPADWTVNRMTENLFLQLLDALREAPNAALQRDCLMHLGEKVPREFDALWKMLYLEMDANLDKNVSREVGELLKKKGRPALRDRAMKK